MDPNFEALVDQFERNPELRGKLVADVPELAAYRLKFRRGFYRFANLHFGTAIFNIIVATSPLIGWLWPLNALAAGLSVYMMFWSEEKARIFTRELHRRASEQMARDILGISD